MNTPTYWLQLYKEHSRNRKLPAATQTACFNIVLFDRIKCTRLNTKELRSCLVIILFYLPSANVTFQGLSWSLPSLFKDDIIVFSVFSHYIICNCYA